MAEADMDRYSRRRIETRRDLSRCLQCRWYRRQIFSLIRRWKFYLAVDMIRNRTAHRKQRHPERTDWREAR